jgi:hypothetical protein
MAIVSRDPFARTEVHRETVRVPYERRCDWCGQRRLVHRGQRRVNELFKYRVEYDSGRLSRIPKLFDSIDCMREYYQP